MKIHKKIVLKSGKYGRYLELNTDDKPKRVSVPKNISNDEINLEKATMLLKLPRLVGVHPESKKDILASIGPYGPYIKHENKFISLKEDNVLEIGINRAVELINQKALMTKEIIVGIDPDSNKDCFKKGIKGRPDYLSINKKLFITVRAKRNVSFERALKLLMKKE